MLRELEKWRECGENEEGRWPSWIEHATISAIYRAVPVQFGGWPSWKDRVVLVPSAKLLSQYCTKLALVSSRSEVPLELYDFKNRKNSFSRITFGLIVYNGNS
ncbi:hypothetical protein F2Q69_00028479 [Brassica cretica]|uniref:Uncharacterized protein n=1 Tax=Brassica cretica TaxID=69181 RepID=A0A8S9S1B6_BRACR|nr:hypothetical protein F2Q69_00028479 [Brassica cretica]